MHKVNNELIEIRRRFKDYYKENLRHRYVELEPQRKIYLSGFKKRFAWCCVGFVCLCAIFVAMKSFSFDFFFYYLFFTGWICSKPLSEFKKATKSLVMERILSFWGDYKYCNDGVLISQDYIKKSALFGDFNKQKQDDAFRGKYHNVEIEVSEQEISKVRGVNLYEDENAFSTKDNEERIFNGVLIALHLNKKYEGNTIVCEKKFGQSKNSESGNWLTVFIIVGLFCLLKAGWNFWKYGNCVFDIIMFFIFLVLFVLFFVLSNVINLSKSKDNSQVFLEDIVFSKKWNVYADDQVEARYVLTPAMMERILAVKKLFHGKKIDFSFWDNNLLIAIHTNEDMFETTSLFNSTLDYRKVLEVICQMYSVFSVIDALKLQNENKS